MKSFLSEAAQCMKLQFISEQQHTTMLCQSGWVTVHSSRHLLPWRGWPTHTETVPTSVAAFQEPHVSETQAYCILHQAVKNSTAIWLDRHKIHYIIGDIFPATKPSIIKPSSTMTKTLKLRGKTHTTLNPNKVTNTQKMKAKPNWRSKLRTVHMYVYHSAQLSYTTQHKIVVIIFPCNLQMNIIAQTLAEVNFG